MWSLLAAIFKRQAGTPIRNCSGPILPPGIWMVPLTRNVEIQLQEEHTTDGTYTAVESTQRYDGYHVHEKLGALCVALNNSDWV